MLKSGAKSKLHQPRAQSRKALTSNKPEVVRAYQCGLNRRAFLKQTGAFTLFASLLATKPVAVAADLPSNVGQDEQNVQFDDDAKIILTQVQMHLFPDDGDGPSANDLNAFAYLSWALTDPENQAEGDQEFIVKGVSWLQDLSQKTHGGGFMQLTKTEQEGLLHQIARSRAGENWLSMLLYYLLEALTLDPVYGGNVGGIGWQWLAHQPGYPQPVVGKTYRDFQ